MWKIPPRLTWCSIVRTMTGGIGHDAAVRKEGSNAASAEGRRMLAPSTRQWTLTLLGRWQLNHLNSAIKVTPRQQTLIAAMALHRDRSRSFLSHLLWGDSSEAQAMGNLRRMVWQLRRRLPGLILDHDGELGLTDDVHVDVEQLHRSVDRISASTHEHELRMTLSLFKHAVLLPSWNDDWVVDQQEKMSRMRIKVFELLAHQFISRNAPGAALDAAQAAVSADPMRETAHRLLAESHIKRGDPETAAQVFRRFRSLCLNEIGTEPSQRFARLFNASTPVRGQSQPPTDRRLVNRETG